MASHRRPPPSKLNINDALEFHKRTPGERLEKRYALPCNPARYEATRVWIQDTASPVAGLGFVQRRVTALPELDDYSRARSSSASSATSTTDYSILTDIIAMPLPIQTAHHDLCLSDLQQAKRARSGSLTAVRQVAYQQEDGWGIASQNSSSARPEAAKIAAAAVTGRFRSQSCSSSVLPPRPATLQRTSGFSRYASSTASSSSSSSPGRSPLSEEHLASPSTATEISLKSVSPKQSGNLFSTRQSRSGSLAGPYTPSSKHALFPSTLNADECLAIMCGKSVTPHQYGTPVHRFAEQARIA